MPSALAVDPNRTMQQYIREAWGSERGFPGGSVSSIAQTPDGYLWIGTEKGLVRFDGMSFHSFETESPTARPIGAVVNLITDADGNLWIQLKSTRVLRYRDGVFEPGYQEAEIGITAICRGENGAVFLSSLVYGTLTYSGGKYQTLQNQTQPHNTSVTRGEEAAINLTNPYNWNTGVATHRFAEPRAAVIAMASSADSKVWLGTQDRGLFSLNDGRIAGPMNGPAAVKITCLLARPDGKLWIGTEDGVIFSNNKEMTRSTVPAALRHVRVLSMLKDRNSNVWIGTSTGVIRWNEGGIAIDHEAAERDESTGAIFEDRDGNIWMGGSDGIQRLRDSTFINYAATGVQSPSVGPVYVNSNGQIWFAPIENGLRWLNGDKTGGLTIAGLGQDVVYSITGTENELWLGRQTGGLTHLHYDGSSTTATTYTTAEGLAQNSVYTVYRSRDGDLWAGTLSGGISRYDDRQFTTYTTANGLVSNTITSITEGADGTMWFATPGGLNALSKDVWKTYRIREGLPAQAVTTLFTDSAGTVWIGTPSGLAFYNSGSVHIPHDLPQPLRGQIFGIAEDRAGSLWIATSARVFRISRDGLLTGKLDGKIREFGHADGLSGAIGPQRQSSVFADHMGRIWFSTSLGLSMVDPGRILDRPGPAQVRIEELSVDGNTFATKNLVNIPPAHRRIAFRYAGLSLSSSEGVKYRYKLDGFDKEWSAPVTTREAVYTNLGPGPYRFRVTAENGDGVWNKNEATLGLTVIPAFYQTLWFRTLLVLTAVAGVCILFQFRLRQIRERLSERIIERERIARELHDTLLQGFQALILRFHTVMRQMPEHEPLRQMMEKSLDVADQVLLDGRNRVRDLRAENITLIDLPRSLTSACDELHLDRPMAYRLDVQGIPRELNPIVREEADRIGREALVNAFRHSSGSNIEVEIRYDLKELRLRVRDDGRGIDKKILSSGHKDGHWGLLGMRERAQTIGGHLSITCPPSTGTEVVLKVPAAIAYLDGEKTRRWQWLRRVTRRQR